MSTTAEEAYIPIPRPTEGPKSFEEERKHHDTLVKEYWGEANKNNDARLDVKEITNLFDHLNLKIDSKHAKQQLKKAFGTDKDVLTTEEDLKKLIDSFRVNNEVLVEEFQKYAKKSPTLSVAQFQEFLKTEQKEDVSPEKIKEIFKEFDTQSAGPDSLTLSGFVNYVTSPSANGAYKEVDPNPVLDQPLTHYFIASSHNTYLMADQLKGPSHVDAYKNALLRGCRCVELDCWDGPDGNPIVYHGHTLTSKILFKDVLETIKKYGFRTTPYPIILSLEVHCNVDGQNAMAKQMREILGVGPGGMEVLPKNSEEKKEGQKYVALQTPEQLKNRILIKGKKVPFEDPGAEKSAKDLANAGVQAAQKVPVAKISKDLSELVYLKATGFGGFESYEGKWKSHHMSSFCEDKVELFSKKSSREFVKFNSMHFSRIFPKGGRIDSSNYDPIPAWNHGCSIVALNYQTASKPLFINDGKFLQGNKAGYVLKPKYFVNHDPAFNPEKGDDRLEYEITVISAWQLPKSISNKSRHGEIIDPYVKIYLKGVAADEASTKTKRHNNNGFNPEWNHKHTFKVSRPELAVLLFVIWDHDLLTANDLIAQYALPLKSLKEGIRSIDLKGRGAESLNPATLLIRTKVLNKK